MKVESVLTLATQLCLVLNVMLPQHAISQTGGYMATLQDKLIKAWHQKTQTKNPPTIGFIIYKNGTVGTIKVVKPSGNEEVDKQAIQTVKNCAPYAKLPNGAPESIDIEYTFTQKR